jgi:hypothetical protein
MAFVGKFGAGFQRLILDRVQAVLERDANAAIAAVDSTLDPIKDFDTPTPIALNFPALYLEPDGSRLAQSDDDSYIEQEHSLLISLAIVGKDPDTLKTKIVRYVQAIDQVLRTMTNADLTGGVTTAIRKAAWEVTDHRYGLLRAGENTIYRKDAQLTLIVQILER